MRYLGGKTKIGKKIARYLNRVDHLPLYVPFVGSAGVLQHCTHGTRIAGDANAYMIALWLALDAGWQPPETISQPAYDAIKNNPKAYDPWLVAFVAVGCSWGGKWFGGYARGEGRNWSAEAQRSLARKMPRLQGVQWQFGSYADTAHAAHHAIIYCDPPYAGTTGYDAVDAFDSDAFWLWCQRKAENNIVIVSEFHCPVPHVLLWQKKPGRSCVERKGRVEKLFAVLPAPVTLEAATCAYS